MEKTWDISDLVARLQPDPWRANDRPFSPDMEACHAVLFASTPTRREKVDALTAWLAGFQPCLFGQMEARQKRLAFCLLNENDLESSDQDIRQRIEEARTDWRRLGLEGHRHGFLIVAVSPAIARARLGPELHDFALKLCELYLGVSGSDVILHDGLILAINRASEAAERRSWRVGVNYFSAQGDGRWWHDHRIPGGMAFSMNSVGHMARALAERERVRNAECVHRFDAVPRDKLVYWALPRAMKTIGPLQDGSTKGTWLAPHGSFQEDREPPSFEERQRYFHGLAGYSPNRYKGLYHTDHTVPSPYFDEGLWRREELAERDDLYFTYLHDLADPDYQSMGLGLEIVLEESAGPVAGQDQETR